MKDLLKLIAVGGIAFWAFHCFHRLNPLASQARYRVEWSGAPGAQLYGSYVIQKTGTPIETEKVSALLPYTQEFSAPDNAIVTATGSTLNHGEVDLKIFKNDAECGRPVFVGSGAMANLACQ